MSTTSTLATTLGARLDAAYDSLHAQLNATHRAAELTIRARRALVERQQAILVEHAEDPKALGSNEAARAATLSAMTKVERNDVTACEEDERNDRHALELMRLHVESARAALRVEELAAGIERAR